MANEGIGFSMAVDHISGNLFFFNFYLATRQPNLDHYQGDGLTHPLLITVILQF